MLQSVPSLLHPPCAIADTCKLASRSYDAKRPHRGRSYRVALNGVGALTARTTLFNQCVGKLAARGRSS